MKTTYKKLLLLLIILVGLRTYSQQGIGVTLQNYTVQYDTSVNLGYTITVNALVQNFDSTSFVGVLDFGLRNTRQNLSNTQTFNKPPYSGATITLQPFEVIPAIFSINVDPQYFAPGPDVVVVWPISNRPIADSILIPLNIDGPNSVTEKQHATPSICFHNGNIEFKHPNNTPIEQVRIYNLSGELISSFNNPDNNCTPLPKAPNGIYIYSALLKDGTRLSVKYFSSQQ